MKRKLLTIKRRGNKHGKYCENLKTYDICLKNKRKMKGLELSKDVYLHFTQIFSTECDKISLSIEKRGRPIEINLEVRKKPPLLEWKKKKKTRKAMSKFTGPSDKIHAWLIPAYSGLSQSFLPRSSPSWCQLRQINVRGQCERATRARCRYQDV